MYCRWYTSLKACCVFIVIAIVMIAIECQAQLSGSDSPPPNRCLPEAVLADESLKRRLDFDIGGDNSVERLLIVSSSVRRVATWRARDHWAMADADSVFVRSSSHTILNALKSLGMNITEETFGHEWRLLEIAEPPTTANTAFDLLLRSEAIAHSKIPRNLLRWNYLGTGNPLYPPKTKRLLWFGARSGRLLEMQHEPVAVLDSGLPAHGCLVWSEGYDATKPKKYSYTDPDVPWDWDGHGTFCAGIAAARCPVQLEMLGIRGVDPLANLMPIKVLSDDGCGSESSLSRGIIWAAQNGIKVESISLEFKDQSLICKSICDSKQTLVVAAAGDGEDIDLHPNFPAACRLPNLLSVGGFGAGNSRIGAYGFAVDLSAPAENITSAWPPDSIDKKSGTSAAAAAAAGVASLIRAKNPALSPASLRNLLIGTSIENAVVGIPSGRVASCSGGGVLSPDAALGAAMFANPVLRPTPKCIRFLSCP